MTNWRREDIKTSQTEESVSPWSSSLTASASGNPLVSSGFPVSKSNMSTIRIKRNSTQTAPSSSKINAKAKQCSTNTHQGHLTPLQSLHHHSAHPWNKTILSLLILLTDLVARIMLKFSFSGVGVVIGNAEQQDRPVKIKTNRQSWKQNWDSPNSSVAYDVAKTRLWLVAHSI